MTTSAAFPVLMNLMRIVIQPMSASNTVIDDDFREAVGVKDFGTAVEMEGQVNLKYTRFSLEPLDRTLTGDREGVSRGKLVFKYDYLVQNGYTINKGDIVVEFGPVAAPTVVNKKIYEVTPTAPLRGQFTLLEAKFEFNHDEQESITGVT